MENVVTSKTIEQTEEINKIYCAKCEKELIDGEIDDAFKITMGLIIKNDFFSAAKTVYYHRECL
ncbi:MAG: hypothetical protein ACFFBP_09705 [Promethearchaeota archaeon]